MAAGNGPSSGEYSFLTFFMTPKLFVKQTVTDYLWGYPDPVTDTCNSLTPDKCPNPKVGVMLGVRLFPLNLFTIQSRQLHQ